MHKRLICPGFELEQLIVPPFEVSEGELVGLAIPVDFGERWFQLMNQLSSVSTHGVRTPGKVALVESPMLEHAHRTELDMPVEDYIMAAGLSHDVARTILDELALAPAESRSNLQLAPRLLLDLSIAWRRNVDLLLLSTAGLDPNGIKRVAEAIHRRRTCAALDVISTSLAQHYKSVAEYARVIQCETIDDSADPLGA